MFSIAEKTVPKLPNILVSMETRKPFNIFRRNILIWKESTLRNFKKAYQDKLKVIQRQEGNVQQVTSLESLPRGRPPLLLELDCKLISFVKNLRARGGVVTGSVISAAAKGLIRSNPSLHQRYHSFEPTRGWIQSIYRRCNFSRRAGTTTRPPVSQRHVWRV